MTGILWSMDIETESWDIPVLGRAISSEGHRVAFDEENGTCWQGMWDWYASLDPSDTVISHNGGRYDFLALIDSNPDAEWSGTLGGAGLVSLRAEGGAECRDSLRVFPLGLGEWTGQKEATGLPCNGRYPECKRSPKGCGGYCEIRRDMSPAFRRRAGDYCLNDCEILLAAWQRDIARLESEGFAIRNKHGQLRRTVGSIGYETARILGDLPNKGLDWLEYEWGLRGYYGGNVQDARVWVPAETEGRGFDITQAYPWALCQPVPDGKPEYITRPDEALRAFAAQRPGVYTGRVRVPDSRVPLLPHRSPKGRLLWACGELEGAWTNIELETAIHYGAVLRGIDRAMVYPTERVKYGQYMTHAFECRDRAKAAHVALCAEKGVHPDDEWTAEKSWSTIVKFLANSVSGKLAQSPGVARLVIGEGALPPPDQRRGKWDPLGRRAWMQTVRPSPPKCARPAEAAYLTSRVRAERLLPALLSTDAWYWDTDGLKCGGTIDPKLVGKALGDFKDEGPVWDWCSPGPKLYSYRTSPTPKNPEGRVVRMKGFPRPDEEVFRKAVAGEEIPIDRGVKGIRSALKEDNRAFKRKNFTRAIRSDRRLAGTRYILPDGYTVPLHRDNQGKYSWPVEGSPDPEEILKLSKRKPPDVWTLLFKKAGKK